MAISFDNVNGWLIRGGDGEARDVQWAVSKRDGKLLWGKPVEYVVNTSTTLLMPAGKYRIVLIGAGGGGAWQDCGKNDDGYQKATGGGGAGVKGLLTLPDPSSVTIVVGMAGNSKGPANFHGNGTMAGTAGASTFISIGDDKIAVANGGGGGWCTDTYSGSAGGGTGGIYYCNSAYISDFSGSTDGNSGHYNIKWYGIPSNAAYADGPFAEYPYGYSGGNATYNRYSYVEARHASDGAAFITAR